MKVPFVDLHAQYAAIESEANAAMNGVLKRGDYILGQEVELFEADFAKYIGTRHAIGVASGVDALELALRAYGIGPGDEVITAANTFIATVLAVLAVGARPVLADADPETYNISPSAMEAAITPRTRALIPVHLCGQPADMDEILAIAAKHNLIVIEDAAQAHGAMYQGRRAGSLGHAAAFSFYPAKNLGAYGDGGMVVTSDNAISEKIRQLRNYGQSVKYVHVTAGTNSRLDTLQAAVLRVKLRHLDAWNQARQQHAAAYGSLLREARCTLPKVATNRTHVFHLYMIEVENRSEIQEALSSREIGTGIHYPIPVHLQAACANLGYRTGDFPAAERAAAHILSLPMYAEMRREQAAFVAVSLLDAIGGPRRTSQGAAV
ncbi:MAG: DegT/DnrJ/EryC1/StrS family aminotransferase [Candidatus Acidiferrales bacterium]